MSGTTQIEGALFDTIQYMDDSSLGKFLDNLKKEQALFVIAESIRFAFEKGVFNLKESEALSRSLRVLNNVQ
jgi:hypothetical protein